MKTLPSLLRKSMSGVAAIAACVVIATTAMAASKNFTHATGGIALSGGYSQYVSFNAFDYGATGDRGTVAYTNFDYPAAGTGVWNVVDASVLVVAGSVTHSMTIDSVTPISTTATKFSGTGSMDGSSCTWTVKGFVTGPDISYVIVYDSNCAPYYPYSFSAVGTIAADGSISGMGTDSTAATYPWVMPAGSAFEVLNYTASVSCAVIDVAASTATFVFMIPPGFPGLSDLNVVAKVFDGGSPGTNGDTWAHGVAASACDGTVGAYPIVGGNLVVH